jgi:peptidylprolyl isomerase
MDSKKLFVTGLISLILIIGLYWGSNYEMTGNVINNIFHSSNNTNVINNIFHLSDNTMENKVLLTTNQGDIIIQLYEDMPITTGNFKNLVEQGTYNKVIFHRIIPDFMIQGGDPTGTGFGDPSIPNIQDEFTHSPSNQNNRGTISMANAGPNTGSSQFFINLADNNFLDTKHPAFGEVIEGMDIVEKLAKVQTNPSDKPLEDVIILEAKII